jgi:hypothetical protein
MISSGVEVWNRPKLGVVSFIENRGLFDKSILIRYRVFVPCLVLMGACRGCRWYLAAEKSTIPAVAVARGCGVSGLCQS